MIVVSWGGLPGWPAPFFQVITMISERAGAAYHESGHLIAAYRLGAKIHRAEIGRDGRTGYCVCGPRGSRLESLIYLEAGDVGMGLMPRCHRYPDVVVRPDLGETDSNQQQEILAFTCKSPEIEKLMAAMVRVHAELLILGATDALDRLAELLARRVKLDGEEIESLLLTMAVKPYNFGDRGTATR